VINKNGERLNKPIDMFNHALDAVRYVALNKLRTNNQGKYNISIVNNSGGIGRINTTSQTKSLIR
jgi:hypothetical protein